MISSITQLDNHVTITNGSSIPPYINTNYAGSGGSGMHYAGEVRYNGVTRVMEVFNGTSWQQYDNQNASIGLSHKTKEILEWAEHKMLQEKLAIELADQYPAVQNALDTIKKAEEQLAVITTLIKSGEQNEGRKEVAMPMPKVAVSP